MKKALFAVAASLAVSGCAFPVVSTELPPNWGQNVAAKRTGTNLPPRWQDTNVKYMGREEFEKLTSGQGSSDPLRR